jgi:hypothetical protein
MNYNITFSTYRNNSGTELSQTEVVEYLKDISQSESIEGWSLKGMVKHRGRHRWSFNIIVTCVGPYFGYPKAW